MANLPLASKFPIYESEVVNSIFARYVQQELHNITQNITADKMKRKNNRASVSQEMQVHETLREQPHIRKDNDDEQLLLDDDIRWKF